MRIQIRVFMDRLFWKSPYYLDYGDGMFGAFKTHLHAARARALWRKKDQIRVQSVDPPTGVCEFCDGTGQIEIYSPDRPNVAPQIEPCTECMPPIHRPGLPELVVNG